MVNGITMIGAILSNKSPVGLDQVTPIARLTGDPLVIVVPANSPIKYVQELAAAAKADPAKVTWAGGSAGGADHILAALFTRRPAPIRRRSTTSPSRAAARPWRPCSADG